MAIDLDIDDYSLEEARALVADFGTERYGFLVTPNVDHLIRFCSDSRFRAHYAKASFVFLDSRFFAGLLMLSRRLRVRVCPGSDLTTQVFSRLIASDDCIVLVGGSAQQAQTLRQKYSLQQLHHIDPTMGFINDPAAVESCLNEIEALSPFRYCFLAIGSPQQEIIAAMLQERGRARGLALCIGASVNFLTGVETRAPHWMQRSGIEWLFRLAQDPKRLAKRYLVRGPRIFLLLPRFNLRLRRPMPAPASVAGSAS